MPEPLRKSPQRNPILRAVVEIAFVIFLFYSNLLMGQFDASNQQGKTFSIALHNVVTEKNFAIAIGSALIGYVVFEYLRKQL